MILLLWLQQYNIINTRIYYETASLKEKQRDILTFIILPSKKGLNQLYFL